MGCSGGRPGEDLSGPPGSAGAGKPNYGDALPRLSGRASPLDERLRLSFFRLAYVTSCSREARSPLSKPGEEGSESTAEFYWGSLNP